MKRILLSVGFFLSLYAQASGRLFLAPVDALTVNESDEEKVIECHPGGMTLSRHWISKGQSVEGIKYLRIWISGANAPSTDVMIIANPKHFGSAKAATIHGAGGMLTLFQNKYSDENGLSFQALEIVATKTLEGGNLEQRDMTWMSCRGDVRKLLR